MRRYLRILGVYAIVGLLMIFATLRLGMRPRMAVLVFCSVLALGLLHCVAVLIPPENPPPQIPDDDEKSRGDG